LQFIASPGTFQQYQRFVIVKKHVIRRHLVVVLDYIVALIVHTVVVARKVITR
jgi:hypothetical protein